jgi:hypothetical protein
MIDRRGPHTSRRPTVHTSFPSRFLSRNLRLKGDSVLSLPQGLDLDAFAFDICGHEDPPSRGTDASYFK